MSQLVAGFIGTTALAIGSGAADLSHEQQDADNPFVPGGTGRVGCPGPDLPVPLPPPVVQAINEANTKSRGSAFQFHDVKEHSSMARFSSGGDVSVVEHPGSMSFSDKMKINGAYTLQRVLKFPSHRARIQTPSGQLRAVVVEHVAAIVQPLYPLPGPANADPAKPRIGYFEVEILNDGDPTETLIAVGLVRAPFPDVVLPGFYGPSVSIMSNGALHRGTRQAAAYCAPWRRTKAIVGCGIVYGPSGHALGVFFTLDGKLLHAMGNGGEAPNMESSYVFFGPHAPSFLGAGLHAAVGTMGEAMVGVNFGEHPFKWDPNTRAVFAPRASAQAAPEQVPPVQAGEAPPPYSPH